MHCYKRLNLVNNVTVSAYIGLQESEVTLYVNLLFISQITLNLIHVCLQIILCRVSAV